VSSNLAKSIPQEQYFDAPPHLPNTASAANSSSTHRANIRLAVDTIRDTRHSSKWVQQSIADLETVIVVADTAVELRLLVAGFRIAELVDEDRVFLSWIV